MVGGRYEDNGDSVNNFVVIKVPTSKTSIESYGSQDAFLQELSNFGLFGKQAYTGVLPACVQLPPLPPQLQVEQPARESAAASQAAAAAGDFVAALLCAPARVATRAGALVPREEPTRWFLPRKPASDLAATSAPS